MADDDLTPRQRRAQKASRTGAGFGQIKWSKAAAPLAVLAVLALVTTMVVIQATRDPSCPGHWHSSFHVYVHDERIDFDLPKYRLQGETPQAVMPLRMHMHNGDLGQQIHWEPRPERCLSFGDFAALTEMQLSPGELVLTGAHEDAGQGYALKEGRDDGTLRAYYASGFEDDWQPISIGKLNTRQPKDCERELIVWGNHTVEQIVAMQDRVQPPSQCRGSGPG